MANVVARSQQGEDGVVIVYEVVRAERIFAGSGTPAERSGTPVAEVVVRGNKRVEEDAIRARIGVRPGMLDDPTQVARDVRAIFDQGFFADVRVFREETPAGHFA